MPDPQTVIVEPFVVAGRLTPSTRVLLERLAAARPGQVVTHAALADALYWRKGEPAAGAAPTIRVLINRLRKLLPAKAIVLVWGVGYVLRVPVVLPALDLDDRPAEDVLSASG